MAKIKGKSLCKLVDDKVLKKDLPANRKKTSAIPRACLDPEVPQLSHSD